MLAKAIGVKLNKKHINTMNKEHLAPEFLKINPQHTIPTLVDNDFSIWESRAILTYLAEKYGKNDSLYPKDVQKRAVINQRLYFDMGTMYQRFYEYYIPQMMKKLPADPEKFKKMEEGVEFLDGFLALTAYVAGDELTIADYALFSSWSTYDVVGYDFSRFANISRWYDLCKSTMPGVEESEEGIIAMKGFIEKFKEHTHDHE
jgi:glutathione S-transferase